MVILWPRNKPNWWNVLWMILWKMANFQMPLRFKRPSLSQWCLNLVAAPPGNIRPHGGRAPAPAATAAGAATRRGGGRIGTDARSHGRSIERNEIDMIDHQIRGDIHIHHHICHHHIGHHIHQHIAHILHLWDHQQVGWVLDRSMKVSSIEWEKKDAAADLNLTIAVHYGIVWN